MELTFSALPMFQISTKLLAISSKLLAISSKLLAISYHTLISLGLGKLNNKGARTAVATVVDLGSVSKGPGVNFINVISACFFCTNVILAAFST